MLYAIIAEDKPNGLDHRLAVRPRHLEHLKSLGDTVVFAGALLDGDEKAEGSLMVIEAGSQAEAEAIANQDPFVKEDVFASVSVRRWNWAVNNPTARGL